MNEPTRRPWQYSNRNWRGQETEHDWYITGDHDLDDGEGSCVGVAIVKGNATSGSIAEANAALIVKAVNCHADLLAACKTMLDDVQRYLSRGGTLTDCEQANVEKMQEVVAKAEAP